jgi:hypothetical protein
LGAECPLYVCRDIDDKVQFSTLGRRKDSAEVDQDGAGIMASGGGGRPAVISLISHWKSLKATD